MPLFGRLLPWRFPLVQFVAGQAPRHGSGTTCCMAGTVTACCCRPHHTTRLAACGMHTSSPHLPCFRQPPAAESDLEEMQAAIATCLMSLTGAPGWHIELVGGSRRQQRPAAADGTGGSSVLPKQHHDAGRCMSLGVLCCAAAACCAAVISFHACPACCTYYRFALLQCNVLLTRPQPHLLSPLC